MKHDNGDPMYRALTAEPGLKRTTGNEL